ncbi:MAG: HIRAN domain-containing protein [Ostreibacterium sp.]
MFSWVRKFWSNKKQQYQWIADVSIAGLQHYRGNDLAELIKVGDTLNLQQQPNNAYDEHAIMVLWHHNKIGYIPRALAKDINRQLVTGIIVTVSIIEIKPVRFGRKWIKIRLESTP